jgi:hypothetical protein
VKSACWLVVLVACTSPPAPSAPEPETTAIYPPYPGCPPTIVCSQRSCPECPKPPQPVIEDWYCFDVVRPTMPLSGLCWPSQRSCEYNREDIITRKIGKPGPCVTQRTAYCFVVSDGSTMYRQRLCAREPDNCERRREWAEDNKQVKTRKVGPCEPTLNIDPYDTTYDTQASALPLDRAP